MTLQTSAGQGIPEATGGHPEHPVGKGQLFRVGRLVQSQGLPVTRPSIRAAFGCLEDMLFNFLGLEFPHP